MTSSDAPTLLDDQNPHSSASRSRRALLARMRPESGGEQRGEATPATPGTAPGTSPGMSPGTVPGAVPGAPAGAASGVPEAVSPAPKPTPTPLSQPRILDATEACLREYGYDGTTIRRIASRLECAVGTIYRHFTDKRTLLDGVTQRRFETVVERVEQGAEVRETAALYLRTAAEEPQQYRLMFWLASVGDHDKPGVPEVVQRILQGWTKQFGDANRAQRFWAQLHGALMLGIDPDAEQVNGGDLPVPPAAAPSNGNGNGNGSSSSGKATARPQTLNTEDMTLL